MAFIYLCATITLLVPNLVGGQGLTERGVSFLRACYEGPPCECYFGPAVSVFVITSPSSCSFQLLRGAVCIISNRYQWSVRL